MSLILPQINITNCIFSIYYVAIGNDSHLILKVYDMIYANFSILVGHNISLRCIGLLINWMIND